ncbi:hypothetical protein OKW11_000522 [Pseudomonas baetica]|nr:hypothetical protein [Pseudomonas baetica]
MMPAIGRCLALAADPLLQATVVLSLKYIVEHDLQSTMIRAGIQSLVRSLFTGASARSVLRGDVL